MRDDEDPTEADQMQIENSIAAQKARKALQNPRLQKSLAELRAVTPAGEPMFGFQIKAKDARADVPKAELVQLEEGAAIIADKEAAAAYVESAAPTPGLSPRMPTGKVRLAGQPPQTGGAEQRRQPTQPSLARGGTGPRPPSLEERPAMNEEAAEPAVLDRAAHPSPASRGNDPTSRHHRDAARRHPWIVPGAVLVLFSVLAVLALLRTPKEGSQSSPALTVATTSPVNATAPTSTAPLLAPAAPTALVTTSAAPSVEPAPIATPATSARPKATAQAAPAVTGGPYDSPPAPTSTPTSAPAPPSAAPAASTIPTGPKPPTTSQKGGRSLGDEE